MILRNVGFGVTMITFYIITMQELSCFKAFELQLGKKAECGEVVVKAAPSSLCPITCCIFIQQPGN